MQIKLHNSLSRKIEDFNSIDEKSVRMYSCGPTVYNYAHIGNMRAFLFADLLQRILRVVGDYRVKWVMNITNIDDKTIRDSRIGSKEWKSEMGVQSKDPMDNLLKLTRYYEKSFIDDISKLGIEPKDLFQMPRATEYIPQMQHLIRLLIEKGIAYVSEGSVYFSVSEWRKRDVYGRLFHIDFDNFRAGVRIDADQYEREEVSDFVLWKAKKNDEPYWAFEINGQNCDGRPGWHIECSAMEYELLGLPFDIHTGGIDLKFPHHEDEIAQSKAGYGIDPTNYWCHNEFLEVEGEKMSKSKGNFFTLRDLMLQGIDPLDIRFSMLSAHYASTFNFTFDGIKSARKARYRIQEYIYELHIKEEGTQSINIEEVKASIYNELADDLHTPKALAKIFTFINEHPANSLNTLAKKELIELFAELNGVFNVWTIGEKKEQQVVIPQEIITLADKRIEAKKSKQFAEADQLRQQIIDAGYAIKDTKEGYTIEPV